MASARALASWGGINSPVTPSTTASGRLPTLLNHSLHHCPKARKANEHTLAFHRLTRQQATQGPFEPPGNQSPLKGPPQPREPRQAGCQHLWRRRFSI